MLHVTREIFCSLNSRPELVCDAFGRDTAAMYKKANKRAHQRAAKILK